MRHPGLFLVAVVGGVSLTGCSDTPVSSPLRALQRSGEVSFLCITEEGEGRDIDSCPDYDADDDEERRVLALVTQTLSGQVAAVDLTRATVIDVDPSTPGFSLLPVGAMPEDIVSTPGGVASFVGVAEVGKEGIFAMPSTCLDPPEEGERARDLTSWPACALPVAPGHMTVLIDPPDDEGRARVSCDDPYTEPDEPVAAGRAHCGADLRTENRPPGRRKLLVALPSLGQLALIDAQTLLDREPGSFDPCPVERLLQLSDSRGSAAIEQRVPEELQAPGCVEPTLNYGPPVAAPPSRPAGLALAGDLLYVADEGAPVIHRLNVADPCEPALEPPLLPLSYQERGRMVTTSRVAVSPLTSRGERYAYAIDQFNGSVMIFDVSPNSTDRTPIIRPGSPRMPSEFEAPDRIAFTAPARDVAFVLRDEPVTDPTTGVALVGRRCDPDPFNPDPLGVEYRTSGNYRSGARPHHLRGLFGFVMLSSGEVVVIDVEDFDAPCRRPVNTNPAAVEDYRGCAADPVEDGFVYRDAAGDRTVSGEASCRVVERHRARSSQLLVTSSETGVSSPSLRALPLLRSAEGGNLPTDDSEEGQNHPKMLAVEFPHPTDPEVRLPFEVNVGTMPYGTSDEVGARLDLDPGTADRNSLALVLNQPRAFVTEEEVTATYEGVVVTERPAGMLRIFSSEERDARDQGVGHLDDADGRFCDRGVEDQALTREVGIGLGLEGGALEAFALGYADYVQITSEFPDEDDSYWSSHGSVGYTCGDEGSGNGYSACEAVFGTPEDPSPNRDLRIVEAYQHQLVVEPRQLSRSDLVDLIYCCFGAGEVMAYRVRAGQQWVVRGEGTGFYHNVVAGGPDLRCVRDCRPQRALLRGRAFEVVTEDQICTESRQNGGRTCEPHACMFASDPADENEPGQRLPEPLGADSPCVYQNLTTRFAIYRGRESSERDMAFVWRVRGGFVPLSASLVSAGGTTSVSPQSLTYVPQIGSLAVTDGAQKGLIFVSLDTVSVSTMYF